jgi:hypothetical protein
MHDGVTESQDTTELCDVYLVGSELCGVCCVLWCVGSGFQVQGLGSGNLDPMRATVSLLAQLSPQLYTNLMSVVDLLTELESLSKGMQWRL